MSDVKYEYGCEITSTSECPLREEIRADAIRDFIKWYCKKYGYAPLEYFAEEYISEQLKENK